MFAILVAAHDRPRRRVTFERHVEIGRSTRADLVLPSKDVSRRHARIEIEGSKFMLVDHGSTFGTFVDGQRISKMLVTGHERITMGPFAIAIEANAQPDATEERLLAAIAANDVTSRQVYADWLEETGQLERAEFLRAQEALVGLAADDPSFGQHATRLRDLAASIELSWRHMVARPVVENCNARFNLQCPKEWGSMVPTEQSHIRHCSTCDRNVFYAASVQEARAHVERGSCVAVDVIPMRRADDLVPPPRRIMMAGMPALPPPDLPRRR